MGYVKKATAVAGAGLVLAAAVPSFAGAVAKAQEVLIRNTDSEPVPTKAIGTTPVSGSVGINGPVSVSGAVSVPGGVGINGPVSVSGDVRVPDGVAINGTPTVNVAGGSVSVATERFTGQAEAGGGPGGENCSDLAVPAGKRYLVEAVHLDVNTSAEPNVYIRLVRAIGPGNTSLLRFTAPLTQRGPALGSARSLSGRVEGPFVAHELHNDRFETLSVCVNGAGTSARGVFVGVAESL